MAIGSPDKDAVDAVISYYPPQQGCLDEQAKRYGLKKGLATYWDPIPEQAFSKSGIQLFTVNKNFKMIFWNESSHRAEGDDFNFILSNVNENGYRRVVQNRMSGFYKLKTPMILSARLPSPNLPAAALPAMCTGRFHIAALLKDSEGWQFSFLTGTFRGGMK